MKSRLESWYYLFFLVMILASGYAKRNDTSHLSGIGEEDKAQSVGISMEGVALHWFKWCRYYEGLPSWKELKEILVERFGATAGGDRLDILCGLRQETSLEELRRRFEFYSAHVSNVPDVVLKGIFRSGLKKIKKDSILFEVHDLTTLMKAAKKIEERNEYGCKKVDSTIGGNSSNSNLSVLEISSKKSNWTNSNAPALTKLK